MTRRVLNAAVAGAVAFGLGAAPAALADERPVVGACRQVTSPDALNTDGDPVFLTLRKTAANPYDDTDGRPVGSIEDIPFRVNQVQGLSLSTPQGLAAAQKMTVTQARENGLELVGALRTNGNGSVTFAGLEPGMYLVEEIAPDNEHNYRTSAPFLVLLPTLKADCRTAVDNTVIMVKSLDDPEGGNPPTTPRTPSTGTETTTPSTRTPGTGTSTVRTSTPSTPSTPGAGTTVTETEPNRVPPTGSTVTTTRGFGGSGSDQSGDSPTRNVFRDGPLASTGANVLWLLIAAVALISGGVLLIRNRNNARAES